MLGSGFFVAATACPEGLADRMSEAMEGGGGTETAGGAVTDADTGMAWTEPSWSTDAGGRLLAVKGDGGGGGEESTTEREEAEAEVEAEVAGDRTTGTAGLCWGLTPPPAPPTPPGEEETMRDGAGAEDDGAGLF